MGPPYGTDEGNVSECVKWAITSASRKMPVSLIYVVL